MKDNKKILEFSLQKMAKVLKICTYSYIMYATIYVMEGILKVKTSWIYDIDNMVQEFLIENLGDKKDLNKYKAEKIKLKPSKEQELRQLYKKADKIQRDNYWKLEEEEIFYRQAQLLENIENNAIQESYARERQFYWYVGDDKYYSGLDFNEFVQYISWRTHIRNGNYNLTTNANIQLFINELVNLIGCKDTKDALEKMLVFWNEYRKIDNSIDRQMENIIKEFYLLKDIDIKYKELQEKFPIQASQLGEKIYELSTNNFTDKIDILNIISKYKILKSKLLETEYGYLIKMCIEYILPKINDLFSKENIVFSEMLYRKESTNYYWNPLYNYLVLNRKSRDKEVIINRIEKYIYKKGEWTRIQYTLEYKYSSFIGYVLKSMEYYIREYLGYRALKLPEKNEIFVSAFSYYLSKEDKVKIKKASKMAIQELIKDSVEKILTDQRVQKLIFKKPKKKQDKDEYEAQELVEVKFNVENFDQIREQSEVIQKALIIEEINNGPEVINIKQEKVVAQNILENTSENIFKKFIVNLEDYEKRAVEILINKDNIKQSIEEISKKQNCMLEVMISRINDKAIEFIGDTIIENNMEGIYEDYQKDIEMALLGEEN